MCRESAIQCEQLFSSAGNIVNKTCSAIEANAVNMLAQLVVRRHLSEKTLLLFTVFN